LSAGPTDVFDLIKVERGVWAGMSGACFPVTPVIVVLEPLIQFELSFGRYLVHRVTDKSNISTWMFFNQPLALYRQRG
jgi:hypothetical protein